MTRSFKENHNENSVLKITVFLSHFKNVYYLYSNPNISKT